MDSPSFEGILEEPGSSGIQSSDFWERRVRVFITSQPKDSGFEPYPVSLFHVGEVYELGPQLAARLITEGYGVIAGQVDGNVRSEQQAKK